MGKLGMFDDLPSGQKCHITMKRSTVFHGKTHVISTGPSSIANCWTLPEGSGCNPNIDERMRNMEKRKNWIAIRRKDMDPPKGNDMIKIQTGVTKNVGRVSTLDPQCSFTLINFGNIWQSNHPAESVQVGPLIRSLSSWRPGLMLRLPSCEWEYFQAYSVCTLW